MGAASRASGSAGSVVATTSATLAAKPVNLAFEPTKSVSQESSSRAPVLESSETKAATAPSLVSRPAFLAALARPFLRRTSTAASISPSASTRAFLHSIMGESVISRSCLTIAAVICAMIGSFLEPGTIAKLFYSASAAGSAVCSAAGAVISASVICSLPEPARQASANRSHIRATAEIASSLQGTP